MRALPLAAAALLVAGCVQLNWTRVSRDRPVTDVALLVVGETDLAHCLARYGAPLWVLETDDGRGAALAYGWTEETAWGLRFSIPLSDYASADFDYDLSEERTRGVVLFFDEAWTLKGWRQGLLEDLTAGLRRRRPADLDAGD